MKKTLKLGFLGLVISGLFLGGCSQMANYENEDLLLEQDELAHGGFELTPLGGGNENALVIDIEAECVSERQLSAFASQDGNCFIDPGNKGKGKGGRWGWYIEDNLNDLDAAGGMLTYPLIADAGLCDTQNGYNVGSVQMTNNGDGTVNIAYKIMNNDPDADLYYTLGEIHVYADCSKFENLAPGNYGNTGSAIDEGNGTYTASVTIDASEIDCPNGAYIIAHAEVTVCERSLLPS